MTTISDTVDPDGWPNEHQQLIDALLAASNAFAGNNTFSGSNTFTGNVGFWSATPAAQQVLATGVNATVDDVITALQNLGLVKQS